LVEEEVEDTIMSISDLSDLDMDEATDSNQNTLTKEQVTKQSCHAPNAKNRKISKQNVQLSQLSESTLQTLNETCSISECPEYNNLRNGLKDDSVVDRVVLYILDKDINITRLNLDYIILSSDRVHRYYHHVPWGINIGGFSVVDINTILSNWNTLAEEMKLENPKQVFSLFCERTLQQQQLKANILGLYLSQGLSKLRLAADVFSHAEDQNFVKGAIAPSEHDFIMDYISKHGESIDVFKDIAMILKRCPRYWWVLRRYYEHQKGDLFKTGRYTVIENKIIIEGIVSKANIQTAFDIENLNTTLAILTGIAKELGRRVKNVSLHWERRLKPILLQYHAGTLNLNVTPILVEYLIEKNVVHTQDINWEELLSYPQLVGHNKYSLMIILQTLIRSTQKAYKCNEKDVTASRIALTVKDKLDPHKVRPPGAHALQKLEIADFYKCLIDKKKS